MELTAAGTVTDSHRVPFYPSVEIIGIPFPSAKIIKTMKQKTLFLKNPNTFSD
jgi:hypothetical protein